MPVENGYGYGEWTPLKIEHHESILRMHLAIANAVMAKYGYFDQTYHYFDLTSGPGSWDGRPLSPPLTVAFLGAARVPWCGLFLEREPASFHSLRAMLEHEPAAHVRLDDFRDGLPAFLNEHLLPGKPALGLLYYDPTPSDDMFDCWRHLGGMTHDPRLSRVDVLLYVAAATVKRLREHRESLPDVLGRFNKRHWLVRDTFGSRHQYTFLLGTNHRDFPEYAKIRLFDTTSRRGKPIFERVVYTREDRPSHARELFDGL